MAAPDQTLLLTSPRLDARTARVLDEGCTGEAEAELGRNARRLEEEEHRRGRGGAHL